MNTLDKKNDTPEVLQQEAEALVIVDIQEEAKELGEEIEKVSSADKMILRDIRKGIEDRMKNGEAFFRLDDTSKPKKFNLKDAFSILEAIEHKDHRLINKLATECVYANATLTNLGYDIDFDFMRFISSKKQKRLIEEHLLEREFQYGGDNIKFNLNKHELSTAIFSLDRKDLDELLPKLIEDKSFLLISEDAMMHIVDQLTPNEFTTIISYINYIKESLREDEENYTYLDDTISVYKILLRTASSKSSQYKIEGDLRENLLNGGYGDEIKTILMRSSRGGGVEQNTN